MRTAARSAVLALAVAAPWAVIFAVVRWWDVAAPLVWVAVVLIIARVMQQHHQGRTGTVWMVPDPDRDHRTPPLHLFDPSSPGENDNPRGTP